MITSLLRKVNNAPADFADSKLFDEDTFYASFLKDLDKCGAEVIIESPFATSKRVSVLLPSLNKLKARGVKVAVNTRDPFEQDEERNRTDAHKAIALLQKIGVQVVFTTGHHRKLAVLDRKILYEGSLNILSQNNSREVMRRIESVQMAWQMIGFAKLDKLLN
jgi:phosphatidylserine/phosphatidylglycerophosphate/cardiolipin synthase-like enzyme